MRMTLELKRDFFAGFGATAQASLVAYPWPGNVRELKNVAERAVYRMADPTEAIECVNFDPFANAYVEKPKSNMRPQFDAPVNVATDSGAPNEIPAQTKADEIQEIAKFSIGLEQEVQALELKRLQQALDATRFNQRKAAELLQLSYHQLRGYLRKYKIGTDS